MLHIDITMTDIRWVLDFDEETGIWVGKAFDSLEGQVKDFEITSEALAAHLLIAIAPESATNEQEKEARNLNLRTSLRLIP